MTTEQSAEWLRRLHPHRVRFELFSDKNPWMQSIRGLAEGVRANRKPVARDNPFLAFQEAMSNQIIDALDRYRDMRDQATEAFFLNFYGSPAVQAMAGLRSDLTTVRWHVGRDIAREAAQSKGIAELEARIEQGGLVEAGLRALLYVGRGRSQEVADERVFATLRQLRRHLPENRQLSLARFKEVVREQYLLLRHDEERALAAIPRLLPNDSAERERVFDAVRRAVEASGDLPEAVKQRLSRVEALSRDGAAGQAVPDDESGEPGIGGHGTRKHASPPAGIGESSERARAQVVAKQTRQPRRGAAE